MIKKLEQEIVQLKKRIERLVTRNEQIVKEGAHLKKEAQKLGADIAFYRCCALSGEIPNDNQRPSKLREAKDE